MKDVTIEPKRRCAYAKTDMTPCIFRDGEVSRADDGACVGCGLRVPIQPSEDLTRRS